MKKTQKNRRIILVSIILLMLISVGYAAISTNLKINGTANIAATSWNVYFANIQVNQESVTPEVLPNISNTNATSLNYNIVLNNPGDFYEFTVDVVNGGTVNAKIADNSVVNTDLTSKQDELVNYTITYNDGTEIKAGDKLSKNGQIINGIGNTRKIKVRVEFDSSITQEMINEMEEEDIILDLSFSLNYVQD